MTIAVTVKNEDTRENAVISVTTVNKAGVKSAFPTELGPGQSTLTYVHSGQDLLVEEVSQ